MIFQNTRVFAESPEEVYAAFVAPERLSRWWGPAGFRNEFEVFEPREGGAWRFVMVGPDGTRYPNESRIEALTPGELIRVRHVNAPPFTLEIRLSPQDGGTLVTWTQAFDDPDLAQSLAHILQPANEQNLDRWQAELRPPMVGKGGTRAG